MITEMKKLDLLLYHREQGQFLDSLRDAGVVHITEQYEELSKEAEALRAEIVRVDKAIGDLKRRDAKSGANVKDGEELLAEFEEGTNDLEQLAQKLATAEREIKQLEPWGEFDPAQFKKLREHGVYTRFFEVTERLTHLFDDIPHEVVATHKAGRFLVTVEDKKPEPVPGIEPLFLPEISLSQAKLDKQKLEEAIAKMESEMDELAGSAELLKTLKGELEAKLIMEQARLSMPGLAENKLLNLEGWVPADKVTAVEKVLEEFSCWYEFSEPTTEDAVPVKLKNKAGANLFEPITKIFALPDYFEIDPTPFFAPFYALFFGLCLGDLGYGALLLILAAIGVAKVKSETVRPVMILGMVLGLATMISGFFLNTVFGEDIFKTVVDGVVVDRGNSFTFLASTADGQFPAMAFSVYLGMVQIILGMKIKAINGFRSGGWQYLMFPAGTILLVLWVSLSLINIDFLGTGSFWNQATSGKIAVEAVVGQVPAMLLNVIGILGVVLVMLFNDPTKPFVKRLLPGGLGAIYNFATGFMGDALSYIRLFALGLAGGLLGNAFNQIAFMVSGDGAPKALILVTILIMILGHGINFALAALGSFVHPLRLTFVEFYKNIDFKGGAKQYKPLMKTKK